jgi:hypothetical protein
MHVDVAIIDLRRQVFGAASHPSDLVRRKLWDEVVIDLLLSYPREVERLIDHHVRREELEQLFTEVL